MAEKPENIGKENIERNEGKSKTSTINEEQLQTLRSWISTQYHLPYISDKQLILFLHSCYYNVGQTKSCIQSYFTIRRSTPEFFSNRDIHLPEMQEQLQNLNFSKLPIKDPHGRYIFFHSLKTSTPALYNFSEAVRLYFMMIDAHLQNDDLSPGLIMLFDAERVKFGHITRVSLALMRKLLSYVQEGMPIRLKAIHVLNTISSIDQLMFLIKPFMRKEFFELIHFHKGNNETIYNYLPKDCLPKDFGGNLPSVVELHENFAQSLEAYQEYFKEEEERLNIDEIKRLEDDSAACNSVMKTLTLD